MRNAVRLFGAACLAASVSAWSAPVHGQACGGDCNRNQVTTVNELITCVGVALDIEDIAGCDACDVDADGAVIINELIESVQVALGNYALVSSTGLCLRPCRDSGECAGANVDANGLLPCTGGTVQATRCDTAGNCGRAKVDAAIGAGGTFTLPLCVIDTQPLLFTAAETGFRVIDLGSAGVPRPPRRTAAAARLVDGEAAPIAVRLTPASEAGVRLLTANGLERFDAAGIADVTAAVDAALANTSFAGLDPAAAATLATDTARDVPAVQETIDRNLGAVLRVGQASGPRGGTARIAVSLHTGGAAVAGTQNDLVFAATVRVAALPDGSPDCAVNPAIRKAATTFSFVPTHCTGTACTGMRALVLDFANTTPIAEGAELYSCTIAIAAEAPSETIPLACEGAVVSPPEGDDVDAQCTAGIVTVTP